MSNVQNLGPNLVAADIQANDQRIDNDLQATKTTVNNNTTSINSLQTQVNTNATNITTAQNAANAAQTSINNHKAATSGAHAASAISETRKGDAQSALTDLDTRMTSHTSATTGAHGASAISETRLGDAQTALTDLDSRISGHVSQASGAHAASAISETGNGDAQTAINTLRNQVNSIVASGGTGGTEVVSARTSTPDSQTFTSIGQRMDMMDNYDNLLDAARSDIIRKAVNSGVVDYNGTIGIGSTPTSGQAWAPASSGFPSWINKMVLGQTDALVNGSKLHIYDPTNTYNTITLDAPPSANVTPSLPGSARDDLVFLEVWKAWVPVGGTLYNNGGVNSGSTTASYAQYQWQWRIHVVDGVDFATYPEGINHNAVVFAQGSKASVTTKTFSKATALSSGIFIADNGLYAAGTGSSADQTALGTVDGYVYAIPLFRVRRRNSAAYDPDTNLYGARLYAILGAFNASSVINSGQSADFTTDSTTYGQLSVGSVIQRAAGSTYMLLVTNLKGANTVTLQNIGTSAVGNFSDGYLRSDRPDGLFSNIIDASDIIDLRHQVSLTGFNYQALLEKNFDLLLRGQLTTNQTLRYARDYFGLNMSNLQDDVNTLLRCTFDGSINGTANGASVNGTVASGSASYANGVQGTAVTGATITYPVAGTSAMTIEFLFKPTAVFDSNWHTYLYGVDASGNEVFEAGYKNNNSTFQISLIGASGSAVVSTIPNFTITPHKVGEWHYCKVSWDGTTLTAQLDEQIITSPMTSTPRSLATVKVQTSGTFGGYIDCVRISNIVRSTTPLPTGFSYANGDRILDGPNGDFSFQSDDIGGTAGINGRTNPFGLSRVPNQVAARVNYNGQEIRHYNGQGVTPGWTLNNGEGVSPTGSFDASAEYIDVSSNETTDGTKTTFTFTQPSNISGFFGENNTSFLVSVNGSWLSASGITSVSIDSTGKVTAVLATAPTSGAPVKFRYTSIARHAHFIPSTKGFVVHDWTDDTLTADGTKTTFQVTRYNVTSINHVRVSGIPAPTSAPSPTAGGTGGTIPAGTYYFSFAWITPWGYSMASSQSAAVTVSSGQTVTFPSVTLPSWAIGVAVFASTTQGAVGTLQATLTGQTAGSTITPPTVSAYVTNTLQGWTVNTLGQIQNGGYSTQGLNATGLLNAGAAQNATSIVVTGTSFPTAYNGMPIRISNGTGGWVYTTATGASTQSGGNTTIPVTALPSAVSANATVQGAAQITLTTTPAALPSGATVDVIYESVKMLEQSDYVRVAYQHAPYQGLATGSAQVIYNEHKMRVTSFGTGLVNTGAGRFTYPMTTQLPMGNGGGDYKLKSDALSNVLYATGRVDDFWISNAPSIDKAAASGYGEPIEGVTTISLSSTTVTRGQSSISAGSGYLSSTSVPLTTAVPHLNVQTLLVRDTTTGEMYLCINTLYVSDATVWTYADGVVSGAVDFFKLQGRPMIKGYGGVAA